MCYAGQYGEEEGTNEPETPEVVVNCHIESLRNPDRGFHLECNLLADEMKSPYNDYEVYGEDLYKKKIEQFDAKDDNLTLVQQYIYLTKWVSKDLDDEALNNIRKVFELMKAQGYKLFFVLHTIMRGLIRPAVNLNNGFLGILNN